MIVNACGLTRWHPFNRSAAPSRSCVLDSGHEDMCRDGWGGIFEGTRPRPRALTPEEVDELNYAAFAEDNADVYGSEVPDPATTDVYGSGLFKARQEDAATNFVVVPTPGMLPEEVDGEPVMHSVGSDAVALDTLKRWLPTTPDGVHGPLTAALTAGARWLTEREAGTGPANVYGFGGRDAKAGTGSVYGFGTSAVVACPAYGCALLAGHSGDHMDLNAREWAGTKGRTMTRAGQLWEALSEVLNTPGLPADAADTLSRADKLFGDLDAILRAGEPGPDWWGSGSVHRVADATVTYDAVSERLRDRPATNPETWRLVLNAGLVWQRLTEVLREGAPLPEPWRR